MELERAGAPLRARERPLPEPGPGELRIEVLACGVCRTDLHIADGELRPPRLPLVPGHEIVGRVSASRAPDSSLREGDRVGVPWLAWTCGSCAPCARGQENLCERARFTGFSVDGGYAGACVADARYCFAIPGRCGDLEAAPLLCAGLIGFRSLRMAGDAGRLGIYGFGAAGHIVAQVARAQRREVLAFTRPGDAEGQAFARELGAVWAGGSDERPPELLDAAILYAPVGALVPAALRAVRPGGRVVCAGIHMSDIPSFPYADLWEERQLVSVANLTRDDGEAFFELVASTPIETRVRPFALSAANDALDALRAGQIQGAAALVPDARLASASGPA